MGTRQALHELLLALMNGEGGVYFQPPSNIQMTYPCIVYQRTDATTIFADDLPYSIEKQYQVTIIDRDPDSAIPDKVALLPKCRFVQHFAVSSLNHDVYFIYF